MLLVPKIWQEESYLLLEISFLLAEGHRWQKEGLFLVGKSLFLEGNRRGSGEKRQKDVAKTTALSFKNKIATKAPLPDSV